MIIYNREEFLNEGNFPWDTYSESHLNSFFTILIKKEVLKLITEYLKDEFTVSPTVDSDTLLVKRKKKGLDSMFDENHNEFRIMYRLVYLPSGCLWIQIHGVDSRKGNLSSYDFEKTIKNIKVISNTDDFLKFKTDISVVLKGTEKKGYSKEIKEYYKEHPLKLILDKDAMYKISNLIREELDRLNTN